MSQPLSPSIGRTRTRRPAGLLTAVEAGLELPVNRGVAPGRRPARPDGVPPLTDVVVQRVVGEVAAMPSAGTSRRVPTRPSGGRGEALGAQSGAGLRCTARSAPS